MEPASSQHAWDTGQDDPESRTPRGARWPASLLHSTPALLAPAPLFTSPSPFSPLRSGHPEAPRSGQRPPCRAEGTDRAGSGSGPWAGLPFTDSSPSPPIFRPEEAGPAGGPRGAGPGTPGGCGKRSLSRLRAVAVTWHSGRSRSRQPMAGRAGGCPSAPRRPPPAIGCLGRKGHASQTLGEVPAWLLLPSVAVNHPSGRPESSTSTLRVRRGRSIRNGAPSFQSVCEGHSPGPGSLHPCADAGQWRPEWERSAGKLEALTRAKRTLHRGPKGQKLFLKCK